MIGTDPDAVGAGSRVWIIIPTYNERRNLPRVADALRTILPRARILVVDDSSPDGTGDVADELSRKNGCVFVLHRSAKTGLGPAYREAFAVVLRAGAEFVVQMDADLSHDSGDVPRMLDQLRAGNDLVLGSRYVTGGGTVGWPFRRRLLSKGGSLFARAALHMRYRDMTTGFKAWRADTLRPLVNSTASSGYAHTIEMTWAAHHGGARIVELPITFRERQEGSSKLTVAIIREAVGIVLALRRRGAATGALNQPGESGG